MNATNSNLTFSVPGMSCGHCVNAITAEVEQIEGVHHVEIDLDTKVVTVSGLALDDAAIREAIAEAGFEPVP